MPLTDDKQQCLSSFYKSSTKKATKFIVVLNFELQSYTVYSSHVVGLL